MLMSTRSIIARKTDEGFIGTYHHWDGYPSGVGRLVAEGFKKGGWEYLNDVLSHSWSALFNNECHCCGTMSDGRREEIFPYTHETDCGAEFAYVFEHDNEKETDFMHIYQKKDGEGRHVVEFFGLTSDSGEWSVSKTIDLNLPLPNFEKIQESLW